MPLLLLIMLCVSAVAVVGVGAFATTHYAKELMKESAKDKATNAEEQPVEEASEPEENNEPVEETATEEQAQEEANEEQVEDVVEEVASEEQVQEEVVEEQPVEEEPATQQVDDIPIDSDVSEVVPIIVEEPVSEVQEETAVSEEELLNGLNLNIKRIPFFIKMLEAEDKLRDYYIIINNEFHSYRKINIRVSSKGVSYRWGRELVAKMTLRGKTIKMYYALDVNNYDENVYFQKYCGDVKAFEEVPLCVKVRSDRGLKNALKLIEDLMILKGVEKKTRYNDFESIPILLELTRKYSLEEAEKYQLEEVVEETAVTEAPVIEEEPIVEEPVVEEPIVEEEPVVVAPVIIPEPEQQPSLVIGDIEQPAQDVVVIVRTPFTQKMLEADEKIQGYYDTIYNTFNSYRKINIRVSTKGVSFRLGRELVSKLTFRGKTIKLYLALDVTKFDENIYFQTDCSSQRAFKEVPLCVKVRSDRGLRNALKLIEALAEEKAIELKTRVTPIDSIQEIREKFEKENAKLEDQN